MSDASYHRLEDLQEPADSSFAGQSAEFRRNRAAASATQSQSSAFESLAFGIAGAATVVEQTVSNNMSALSQFSQHQKQKSGGLFGSTTNYFNANNAFPDLEAGTSGDGLVGDSVGGNLYSNTIGKLFGGSGGDPASNGYLPVTNPSAGGGGSFVDRISNAGNSMKSSIEGMAPPSAERMQWFGILLVSGIVFLSLSFAFLPMVVLSPHKFALMFSMGSACIFSAQVSLRGLVLLQKFSVICIWKEFISSVKF